MTFAVASHGLGRRFGPVAAVDSLNIAIPQGGVCGFLGPNGSGKTTTIRMMLGLLKPSTGSVEVLGFAAGDRRGLARIGAMVESPSLYPHLTGYENLQVTALMRGCAKSRIDWVLELVGLKDVSQRVASTYSLGMKQRLGLALALLPEPDLLILDEPTNGLDPGGIQEMRQLISHLPQQLGVTVVLSSHLLVEVEQVSSHLIILNRGKLRFQGSLAELKNASTPTIEVETGNDVMALQSLLALGFKVERHDQHLLVQAGRDQAPLIAEAILRHGLPLYRMTEHALSLEDRFMALTEEA